jgi:phenylacetate-CoA ligase
VDRDSGFFDRELETMGPEARAAYRARRLGEVLRVAQERTAHFPSRLKASGLAPEVMKTPKDLARLPVLRKATLPELQKQVPPFGGLLGVPVGSLRRIFVSPGPIYDPAGPAADYFRLARALYAAGFRRGDIVLNTFAYHLTPAGAMCEDALTALGCTVIPGGVGNTDTQVKLVHDLQATGYVGTPSFLATILERAGAMGIDVQKTWRLQVAFVSGAMLAESLRAELLKKYGLRVRQAYATADLGLIAYECARQQGMHLAEDLIVEVCDPETGQPVPPGSPGEVIVTSFDEVYPLIRFGTGDLSALTSEPCPCGRTAARLTRIMGRADEVTKVRGLFVHPGQIDEVVIRFPEVKRYQVVVTRQGNDDDMLVRVETHAREAPYGMDQAVLEALRAAIKVRARLEYVPEGAIPDGAKRILDQRTWT